VLGGEIDSPSPYERRRTPALALISGDLCLQLPHSALIQALAKSGLGAHHGPDSFLVLTMKLKQTTVVASESPVESVPEHSTCDVPMARFLGGPFRRSSSPVLSRKKVKPMFAKDSICDRLGFALEGSRSRTAVLSSGEKGRTSARHRCGSPFSAVRFDEQKSRKMGRIREFRRKLKQEFSAVK